MTEFDVITKAQHYNSHPSGVECIDICRYLTGDWFNAFKYIFRTEHKNGHQDLEKALYYAEDALKHRISIGKLPPIAARKLVQVIAAETDPARRTFFAAVGDRNGARAAEAIRQMLAVLDA